MRTYTLVLFETEYTYRGLTRGEVLLLTREELTEIEHEDKVIEMAILSSTPASGMDWPNTLAGVVPTLVNEIAAVSGLTPRGAEVFRNEATDWIQTPAGRAEMIINGITGMSLPDIWALDPPDWFYQAVSAQTLYDLQNSSQQQQQPQPPSQQSPRPPTARSVPRG